ncbi:hypothetical protein J8B38_16445 [Vibrio parahaemolyticus]|uniref:hypothetical protein n=1 Tax=Vibrio parahaemolyticus TaxID=670 RepID=UPI0003F81B60|nr:hypothetical protein [Vibrio parahaemolyticus]EID7761406.1 hypothetical protein [Vibrio parahaemolyticus]EJF4093449.1 hypothetical protein [Vibrio parahaemolyticus]EJG0302531.1 hypothetical protein [Vibrio parahaemolyticus]EJG0514895.1 hypothetical protein [Vibrio parahaemolyticus]ELB2823434.1 hypothetical protein [Vibrio parahaemolyticus]
MTPIELLEDVKARFPILLHDDEKALLSLLRKALAKYQEIAGFTTKTRIHQSDLADNNQFELPSDFAARLVVKDDRGRYVRSEVWGNVLELKLTGVETFPLTLMYMQNVLNEPFDSFQLPTPCISLLGDYLELLITIPNAERQRRIAIAGKLDVTDIAAEPDLAARKAEIENSMRANRAIVPPVSLL